VGVRLNDVGVAWQRVSKDAEHFATGQFQDSRERISTHHLENLFHRILSFPPTINRNHGVRATRKASELEAVQIFRGRSLARVAIRVKTILHKCRDKMLSHVHGAELDYLEWIQFRGGQPLDAAMV
jgi:hypothetical protein